MKLKKKSIWGDIIDHIVTFQSTLESKNKKGDGIIVKKLSIKALTRTATFKDLLQRKDNQKKVKHNQYDKW